MDHSELATYVEDSLSGLKDFQRASVDTLHERLYQEGRPCMLLADEVGLGKTVVAKGLIARVLEERMEAGKRKPFKVTYICSNQVIAKENLRKLNLFPKSIAMKPPVSRIAYLAWEPPEPSKRRQRQNLLELNTLTPATSFKVSGGLGNKWERRIVFAALCHAPEFLERRNGLGWMLKWTVRKMDTYQQQLEDGLQWEMRKGLPKRFLNRLKKTKVPRKIEAVYGKLEGKRKVSLFEAVIAFADQISKENWRDYWDGSNYLASQLRECLVECCLRYVDADLYILDEFQRFRDLIDEQSDEDHARLARRIFFEQKKDTRILLLSATPFKAFTGYDDVDRGEDHYEDFSRVLRFLLRNDEVKLAHYEKHRQELYRQILDLRGGDIECLSGEHRQEVENLLRSAMCRTERHSVSADPNALILDVWKHPDQAIPFESGDIENFRHTDRMARALSKVNYQAGKPVEYCKSALFPLSFLDRYKLKEELRKHQKNPEIIQVLKQSKEGWLDLEAIDTYEWLSRGGSGNSPSSGSNARLEKLIDQAVGPHGAKLLWVPPSLPYYEMEDAFTGTMGFSKTLLFSSWVMVPRMVSTLVSYEVERRTVGNPATVDGQEAEARTYFTPEGKRRHPVPLIRYARRTQGDRVQLANMSNFTLLFPSQVLAEISAPIENLKNGHSLGELRKQAETEIQSRLENANVSQYIVPGGEAERWYWAAPLLLDRANEKCSETVERWFESSRQQEGETDNEAGEDEHRGAKKEHFEFLESCFEDPTLIGLGQPPENLAEVLADLALGSPAVIALRSLRRLFPEEEGSDHLSRATKIADEFAALFNKPESIAAIRLSEMHQWYWRMVADYCASGCLQAVLDEYFHLVRGQNINPEEAVSQLLDAININASTINVDSLETFQSGQSRKMRCHYASEFGSQRIETDQGQKRASGLREVFNSPFRPFVLSTTSIGQEGLDFHSYCRRIVHWNLPGNPVDLEQREGRINRFKSLVIRQQVARKYGPYLAASEFDRNSDIWETLFQIADREERQKAGKCELVPFWHVEADDDLKIERVIPLYPFSIDRSRLTHILKTLAIYRLAFGQPRQAELVEHLLERNLSKEEIQYIMDNLMINLSPIRFGEEKPLVDTVDDSARMLEGQDVEP